MHAQFLDLAGVDITKGPMEVGPTCHYIMGGVRVEAETGQSRVEGLFAAGECAGGLSGATRLGGNSLSDLLVFGRRAGAAAAEYAAGAAAAAIDDDEVAGASAELDGFLSDDGEEEPYALHAELQRTMQRNVGIYRDEAGLQRALVDIAALKRRLANVRGGGIREYNPGWNLCLDLRNMLICAESIARAALLREESRGAHSRLDFPEYATDWGANSIVSSERDGEMAVDTRPVMSLDRFDELVAERRERDHL
jgi:succinate dehydrogenase / fumarate reductase flavoprotein subunit